MKIKFTLAYPTTLHMVVPDGKQYSFRDAEDIALFLESQAQQEEASYQSLLPRTPNNPPRINWKIVNTPKPPRKNNSEKNRAQKGKNI